MNTYEGWPDKSDDQIERKDPSEAGTPGDAADAGFDGGELPTILHYDEADRIGLNDNPAHRDAGGDDLREPAEAGDQDVVPHELVIGRLIMSNGIDTPANADIPARAPDLLGPGQTTHGHAVRARLDVGLPGAEDYTTLSVVRLTEGAQAVEGETVVGRSFGGIFLPGDGPTDEAYALTRSTANGTVRAAEINKGGRPVGIGMDYGDVRTKLDMQDPVTRHTISRKHALVSVAEDGGIRVSDTGSRNGVTLTFREPAPEPEAEPESRGRFGTYAHQVMGWWRDGNRHGYLDHGGNEL